jgi:hypothetical protein
MTFEQAIIKSVRAYFNGKMPDNLMQAADSKESKYTPDFLDELEKSLIGKEAAKKDKENKEDTVSVEELDMPMNGLLMPPKKGKK